MSHIKTFARLKPGQELYEDYEIGAGKTFSLRVPELFRDYGIQSAQSRYPTISYDFKFDHVFDTAVNQEEVYNSSARDIVTGFLDGYNGTIFAYGQTGTGKTHTMEGSPLRYSDRGLAPRALTQIYKSLEQRAENEDITLSISYLEIYQEVAYDLLSTAARTNSPVTVFPRVTVVEGSNDACTVRNLSVHLAPSEDVASALLLQGQANRKVAETPVNQRSSRSHAVFTVYLAAKKQHSDVITRSKLHLVDLAGSERVAKTGVDGHQLTEAKSINLSLHYLESVIIALQADSSSDQGRLRSSHSSNSRGNTSLGGRPVSSEGGRRHVPYRNSLLTMVLKDSLGGNCQTSMIATISLEVHNLGETLSTCRFAQRVACIANYARRNEEIDDKTLIQQLKRRVAELETQVVLFKMSSHRGESGDRGDREDDDMTSKLTDEDKLTCAQLMQEYLAGRIDDPITAGITSPFKFRECLRILKRMVMTRYFQNRLAPADEQTPSSGMTDVSRIASHTSGNAVLSASQNTQKDTGIAEVQRNGQILRAEDAEKSATSTTAQPVSSDAIDTDELILNIQRLYAASRREQQMRQQGTSQEQPGTPPKVIGTRSEVYKSPYERKREKEIRRLSRKVESLKQSQTLQEQQLSELRMSTAFGELTSMEVIIRNKIQVSRDQIADQHAYLLHLRHTEANQEILQQEKLVEDQLIKREAKFQKKLEELQQKKAELEAQVTKGQVLEGKGMAVEDQGEGRALSAGKVSLEEQFSQYKRRNGTLNTRQVFDMLKSEERKQTKVSQQTETEKKFLMTKQLALREEATREKLKELKEIMRKSRDQTFFGLTGPGDDSSSAPRFDAWTDSNTLRMETNNPGLNQTFVVGRPESQSIKLTSHNLENGRVSDDSNSSNPPRSSAAKTEARHSVPPKTDSQPPLQRYVSNVPSHSSSRADLKWEAAYTHPSTSCSVQSQEWLYPPQTDTSHVSSDDAIFSSITAVPSPGLVKDEKSVTVSSNSNSSEWSVSDAENVCPDPIARELHTKPGHVRAGVNKFSADSRTDTLCHNNTQRHASGDDGEALCKTASPTVMPSEYVHSMQRKDKFDARKMGLSSKTFDSALSAMLDGESRTVSYGFEFYDKYARKSKSPSRNGVASRSPEKHLASTSHRTTEWRAPVITDLPKEYTGVFTSAWGPEAKSSSVAKRLAQFLAEDKSSKSHPRAETTNSTKTTKGVSFLERLSQLQEEETVADTPEVISPRIQALQDAQRESNYMGRIQAEKERVAKIRQARQAAEAIQRAWRRHCRNVQKC